ncbi:MAG: TadE/TadG family type IV pilus assembly protein [Bryobacteraceae bacterium]
MNPSEFSGNSQSAENRVEEDKVKRNTNLKRAASQRGSYAVEAGLVLLPFFAMIFAIIDYSMVFFLQGTFKHAAREGVRFAITQRVLGTSGQGDSIKKVVQTNSMGFLNGTAGKDKISVKFYNSKTHLEMTGVAKNSAGNIVEVTISPCELVNKSDCFQWSWMAPLWRLSAPMTIRARSSDLMEPAKGGILPVF